MKPRIEFPTDRLTHWQFAVQWARTVLHQSIERHRKMDMPTCYDEEKLAQLDDLIEFLDTSWNEHMDSIVNVATEAK